MMSNATVLILEQDDLTLNHLKNILECNGFQVLAANHFKEAFQILKTSARTLSLAILDFELATDDVDVFERLRKLDFDRPIPVLLMGHVPLGPDEVKQLALDSGYAGYIYKSISESALLEQINSLSMRQSDRRKSARVLYQTRVHCIFDEKNYLGEMYTINENGAFIRFNELLPVKGSRGQVSFNAGTTEQILVHLASEVVYVRHHDPKVVSIYPAGVAVRFVHVPEDTLKSLKKLVDYQIANGHIYSKS